MFLKTNRQRWDSNPRNQTVLDAQYIALTTRPPCLTRVHSFVYCVRSKIDLCLCIWNVMTKLELSSKNETSSNRFSDQIVSLKFQVFQSNLLQLSNYQRKRNKNLEKNSILICFQLKKRWFFVKKKLGQKKITWSFFQIPLLGFNRKTYNIGRPIFFINKLKFFSTFNCLTKLLGRI